LWASYDPSFARVSANSLYISPEWLLIFVNLSWTNLLLQTFLIVCKILLFLVFNQSRVFSFLRQFVIAYIAASLSILISTEHSFGTTKTATKHATSSARVDENKFSILPIYL